MNKEFFRIFIGASVLAVHAFCFFWIFYMKDEYLSMPQRISIALLFMPITAAYVVAIIRHAIENATLRETHPVVNLNYAIIISMFTVITLGGLLWTVVNLQGAQESDRQLILLFEVAFGAGFGLIAADLFGKIEVISVAAKRPSQPPS